MPIEETPPGNQEAESKPERQFDYSKVEDQLIPFSDIVRVATSEKYFYMAFGQTHPEPNIPVKVISELMMDPKTAGQYLEVLLGHLVSYEKKFNQKIIPKNLNVNVEIREKENG